MDKQFVLSSEEVIQAAIEASDKTREDFLIDPFAIVFFPGTLLRYWKEQANLTKVDWLAPYHPYATGETFRGNYEGIPITAIRPPMGASPLASVIEDLITCGAKVILLVCGSWGIGEEVNLLDLLIPTHATGPDGVTSYYGRKQEKEIPLDQEIVDLFHKETEKRTEKFHLGKNYSKEAFYRMTTEEIYDLQQKGCISMENGELNVLGTICRQRTILFGAIFYSYYNPLDGWSVSWTREDYKERVELEGEITLAVIERLQKVL
ncbi:MAG: hypothetical protein GF308_05490 [Candidatus Heimdallarchaeota archaeon]|nr:hypothetical protein [Candidatus Heimdallarchaeota archaeon]